MSNGVTREPWKTMPPELPPTPEKEHELTMTPEELAEWQAQVKNMGKVKLGGFRPSGDCR